jgi:hypothetical protein
LPLSFIGILEKCSLWAGEETFSADQKRQIIDEIPRLYDAVAYCGRAPDLKMEELWPFLPKVECATHTLEDLAVNRDRVALITHPNYFVGREEAAAAAHAANPQLRKKAKAPTRRPAQPYRLYPFNDEQLALNFPAWQVLAQLEMRGVRVGRTTAVQNLRELWKTNSSLPCLPHFASFAAAAAAVVEPYSAAAPLRTSPEALLALQNAVPRTPPRGSHPILPPGSSLIEALTGRLTPLRVVAPPRVQPPKNNNQMSRTSDDEFRLDSPPSTPRPNAILTPKRQAALRKAGKPWLNT